MPLLETLRSWYRSLLGREPEDVDARAGDTTESEQAEPRLDPDGVTEVRVGNDEDPVGQLREVRRKQREAQKAAEREAAEAENGDANGPDDL